MDFEVDTLIESPVQDAYRACGLAKYQIRWMASLVEVELDPEVEWGIGSRFRQIHEEAGIRQVFEGVLLDLQEDSRISMKLEHADFTIFTEIDFEDLGQRCRLVQRTRLELKSAPLKLMADTIGGVVHKRLEEDFARLKALCESG